MVTPSPTPAEHLAIAERIRELIPVHDQDLSATALRLGVAELSLRASIDPRAPKACLQVLVAVVREYAVDPMWLLSGDYDLTTHRRAIAENESLTGDGLRELVRGRITPTGIPIPDLIIDDEAGSG